MRAFRKAPGLVELPAGPMLTDRHLTRCQVLPDRVAMLRRMPTGGVAVEVGVQTGGFSRRILDICRPSRLHLIDLDLHSYSIAAAFEPEIKAGVVVLHEDDSAATLARLPDGECDFVYIDGDHSYDGVKRDIEAVRSKVKPDGFLLFNDYTYWSPCECLPYGVVQAVNELCIEDDWEMVYFGLAEFMYCDVALQRRPRSPHLTA
jgi:SAM-dependent methyltransferase